MAARNKCGQPVRDADFVGREADVARLWDELSAHHVLLAAPRRVGKTSLMYHLAGSPRPASWTAAVYYTAEDAKDEFDFYAGLFAELARAPRCEWVAECWTALRVAQGLAKVSKIQVSHFAMEFRAGGPTAADRLACAFAEALRGLPAGHRVLIMVDEFPVLLKRLFAVDRARALQLLAGFRRLRQGWPERDESVRWLLAGSIGLAPLAARERCSQLINDLHGVGLGPMEPMAARRLLSELAESHVVRFSEGEPEQLLGRLGWPLPYFIQIAFAQLRKLPAGTARVDRVMEMLCGSHSAKDFAPWWERLCDELGPVGSAAAESVLDRCASDPGGVPPVAIAEAVASYWAEAERGHQRASLLESLEHDGYLMFEGGRWRFRSPLLREVWLARRSR